MRWPRGPLRDRILGAGRDRLADLLYNRLRLAKEVQLNMWTHFCIRTAAVEGGKPQGGVTIRTRWVEWPPTDLATPVSPAKSGK